MRTNSIDAEELHIQWERFSLKMGYPPTAMTVDLARALRAEIRSELEQRMRSAARPSTRPRDVTATPRAGGGRGGVDLSGLLGGSTPASSTRKTATGRSEKIKTEKGLQRPAVSRIKQEPASSPLSGRGPATPSHKGASLPYGSPNPSLQSFASRDHPGQIEETLNAQIPLPPALEQPFLEPRIKLTANTDVKKFSYRPMAMHLSEASEVLDDRIDEFAMLLQAHHKLEDGDFGEAARKRPEETIAVGRICSDSPEPGLTVASLVLEGSRRMGAGRRIPLRVDELVSYDFFPGQIVGLRGVNASGEYFSVKEVLEIPLLPTASSKPAALEEWRNKLAGSGPDDMRTDDAPRPMSIMVSAGPYTATDNLAFEPLQALCDEAQRSSPDVLLLCGPFLDLEHPLLSSGAIPPSLLTRLDPDTATVSTLFRHLISSHLSTLTSLVPGISIILIPSVRDLLSAHVSFPQEAFVAGANRPQTRKELGLPRQVQCVPNPVTLSLNELVLAVSAQEILHPLKRAECVHGLAREDALARLARYLIQQRHFYPLFPPPERGRVPDGGAEELATGAVLDTAYLKLCDWQKIVPDVLVCPSSMNTFAKVVDGVVVVNPGFLAKRRGFGTFARITAMAPELSEEQRAAKAVLHRSWERCRVDIVRI